MARLGFVDGTRLTDRIEGQSVKLKVKQIGAGRSDLISHLIIARALVDDHRSGGRAAVIAA